jgi:short-subunit dehydrogenase
LVLLSSLVAFQGAPFAANYAATKAYVQALAEALLVELKPHGVAVVACAPGPVRSGFATRAKMQLGPTDAPDTVAEQTLQSIGAGRTLRPGRISKLLGYSLGTLPRFVRVRVMGRIMAGMARSVAR